jgi:hypothetical protein
MVRTPAAGSHFRMRPMARPHDAENFRLQLRLPDGSPAVATELDASGMLLETSARLRPGQGLAFELRAPDSHLVFVAHGEIVSVHRHGALLRVRVHFSDLSLRGAH